MHKEILTSEQVKLLSLVKKFRRSFGLVGGTAIALQIGHRRSIDFDMFSFKKFSNARIRQIIKDGGYRISKTYKEEVGQYTFFVNDVQFTFFEYPYPIKFKKELEGVLKMPDLLTLAAMKVHALGGRAKWKDYVDLYFIINKYHSIKEIIKKAKEIFKGEFNERILREQLAYFDDVNYDEKVKFLPGFEVSEDKIKKELTKYGLE